MEHFFNASLDVGNFVQDMLRLGRGLCGLDVHSKRRRRLCCHTAKQHISLNWQGFVR